MNMDHREALATHASSRYLLGEMNESERFEFEDHYFDCEECSEDVIAGAALARGVRAVCAEDAGARQLVEIRKPFYQRWTEWFSPAALIPVSAALIVVSCFAGYQRLTLGTLQKSRAVSPIVLRAAARGDEQTIELNDQQPYSVLSLDVNAADPGTPLVYEFAWNGGPAQFQNKAAAPPLGSPLLIVVSNSQLNRPGPWILTLHNMNGAEVGRYPFSLKLN
jgi:hypothetical protein